MADNGGNHKWLQELTDQQKEEFSNLETILADGFDRIERRLVQLSDSLIRVVAGKEIIQMSVANEIFKEQRRNFMLVIRMLCITFGLIIVALLGLKALAPSLFGL